MRAPSRPKGARGAWALAVCFVLAVLPIGASAQGELGKVVVRRISGPQGASIRSSLVSGLELAGYEVLDDSALEQAAQASMGPAARPDDDLPRVLAHLGVLAVMHGSVSRRGREWRLSVVVRGLDGSRSGSASWSNRVLGGLRSVRTSGPQRLARYFAAAPAEAPSPEGPTGAQPSSGNPNWYTGEDGPPPDESNPERFEQGPPPSGGEGGAWYTEEYGEDSDGRYDEDYDDDYDEDVDEDTDEDDDRRPGETAPYDRLSLNVYGGFSKRTMSATVLSNPQFRAPFQPGAPVSESRDYNGGGAFELGVSGMIAPGAFLEDPVIPWLQVLFSFRNSVGVKTIGPSCSMATEPQGGRVCPAFPEDVLIATTQREVLAALRMDYRFSDDDRRGPYLTLDAGLHLFQFLFDLDAIARLQRNQIAPPMAYTSLHLGLGARYGLADSLWAGLRFGYRLGLAVGEDTRNIWGTQTGGPQGFTLGVDLQHEMTYLTEGFMVTLSFDFTRFSTTFEGPPNCQNPMVSGEGVVMCNELLLWEDFPDGGGIPDPVTDSYIRFGLSIGYTYY